VLLVCLFSGVSNAFKRRSCFFSDHVLCSLFRSDQPLACGAPSLDDRFTVNIFLSLFNFDSLSLS